MCLVPGFRMCGVFPFCSWLGVLSQVKTLKFLVQLTIGELDAAVIVCYFDV